MAASLQSAEAKRQALTADIAHELRNPLANVRGYLEAAQDDVVAVDAELIRSLLDETVQLQRLVDDLPVRYVGFTAPDEFFVGYGFDLDERYRNLPDLHVARF